MSDTRFSIFDSALGTAAIAWNDRGVAGAQLPQASPSRLRAGFTARFPNAREAEPSDAVALAIERICALLRGEDVDLSAFELDMSSVPEFPRRVYELTRAIPRGATLTYGEIAARTGDPGSARAVGRALGQNPFPPLVPCHRVLAADGRMHGFSASGGVAMKLRLLTIEGWSRHDGPTLFDAYVDAGVGVSAGAGVSCGGVLGSVC
jgi:methylated-DNA-[protein]-cysteine S-methyltransferase